MSQAVIDLDRPKVALVLSGGGAKGLAHVGVLEVLDSLGLPIDMIAGTSMGSIVGGLYAIGYQPDEIREIVRETDWDMMLNPRPEREYLAMEEKDLPERYLVSFDVSKGHVKLPTGINTGQNIYNRLAEVTIGYHDDTTDFDHLPIPFRCIATDLNKGQATIYSGGSLPDAMRASMSIPSFFAPHRYRGRLMVDGGIINNFPADVMRKMGADIVIGVDVQKTSADTLEDPSMLKILEITSLYVNFTRNQDRVDLCDLVMRPELEGITGADFMEYEDIMDRGRDVALKNLEILASLADQLRPILPQTRKKYEPVEDFVISDIHILGLHDVGKEMVLGGFQKRPGDTISVHLLMDEIQELYGSGYFSSVTFNLRSTPHPKYYEVDLRFVEKTAPGEFKLGLNYNTDFRTGLLLGYHHRNLLLKGSKLMADVVVGDFPRARLSYVLDRGWKPGFGIESRWINQKPRFTLDNKFVGNIGIMDWSNTLFLQSTFRNKLAIRAGLQWDLNNYDLTEVPGNGGGEEFPEKVSYQHVNFLFTIKYDSYNQRYMATRGGSWHITAKHYNYAGLSEYQVEDDQFITLDFHVDKVIPLSKRVFLTPSAIGMVSIFNTPSLPYQLIPGGMGRDYINHTYSFAGYEFYQLKDPQAGYYNNGLIYGLDASWNVWGDHWVTVLGNAGIFSGLPEDLLLRGDYAFGYGARYRYMSPVGPLGITVSKGDRFDDVRVYLDLGYWF